MFSSDLLIRMFFGVDTCGVQIRSDELHLTGLFNSIDQGSANFKADCVNVEFADGLKCLFFFFLFFLKKTPNITDFQIMRGNK